MKIEINYDGATARCNVTSLDETSKTQKTKPLYQCSALTKAQVISAFENIKKNLKRDSDMLDPMQKTPKVIQEVSIWEETI